MGFLVMECFGFFQIDDIDPFGNGIVDLGGDDTDVVTGFEQITFFTVVLDRSESGSQNSRKKKR
jgi:hypothetical protein